MPVYWQTEPLQDGPHISFKAAMVFVWEKTFWKPVEVKVTVEHCVDMS